ncbi:MAG: hypothetical protein HY077_09810 [Elusimicrobia bacterium]|nr:hypothetical protein [Elusimicrobiota bacterium]
MYDLDNINSCTTLPREVFGPAISNSAAGLVVAHNHPSGDCTPSAEDRDATRRLTRSGELLGIPL